MSKKNETSSSTATQAEPVQHKMTKKERERRDELEREAKLKEHAKDHHKKHGNC